MIDAVIFSGGGARGIFQVGAYLALKSNQGFRPTIFGGSSVGALNGSLFACNKDRLAAHAWTAIQDNPSLYFPSDFIDNESKISVSTKGFVRIIKHLLTRQKINGLVDSAIKPILEQISVKDLITSDDTVNTFILNWTSLRTGLSVSASARDFPTDEDFRKAILASASFPGIFPTVDHVKSYGGLSTYCLDAGIREVTTLRPVIKAVKNDPEVRITIINCNVNNPLPSPTTYDSIEKNILRSIDIARHTIFKQEIALFQERNFIGPPYYRKFTYRIIEPDPAEMTGVMDFSKKSLQKLYQHGKEQALTSNWVD